jgi:hypothetical protein
LSQVDAPRLISASRSSTEEAVFVKNETTFTPAPARLIIIGQKFIYAQSSAGRSGPPLPERGWLRRYVEHVMQADKGADMDFLVGRSGAAVGRDLH